MIQRFGFLLFFLIVATPLLHAQNVRRYSKYLQGGDYDKLERKILKSLSKDTINPASNYFYSLLFAQEDFKRHQPDSAYSFALEALKDFEQLPESKQEKWERKDLTEDTLAYQKVLLDSLAYEQAHKVHTEEAYQRFLLIHPTAAQAGKARQFRNELAYNKAQTENTYQAYKEFAEKYPEALQVTEAKGLYHFLLFEEKTQNKDLKAYHRFLHEYPKNPYINEAYHQLFEIITAPNTEENYLEYLNTYPKSPYRQRAINMLYHFYLERFSSSLFLEKYPELTTDSLRLSAQMADDLLIPVLADSVYGFMNTSGRMIFTPAFKTVSEDYLCEGVSNDFFVAGDLNPYIIAKNGSLIYSKPFQEVRDMGYGLLEIQKGELKGIVHKAGFQILPVEYESFHLALDSFISYKKGEKWGLATMSGRKVFDHSYDSVYQEGEFIVLEKEEMLALTNKKQLLGAVDNSPVYLAFIYDDAEQLKDEYIVAYRDDQETLLNQNLTPVIPLGDHRISDWYGGWILKRGDTYQVYDTQLKTLSEQGVRKVNHNANWLALKKDEKWELLNRNNQGKLYQTDDSLRLLNEYYTILFKGDTTLALFDGGLQADISDHSKIRLLTSVDENTLIEESFLMVTSRKGQQKVYNKQGKVIIEGNYEEILPAGHQLLVVKNKRKEGLYSSDGEKLLPATYDAVGRYRKGYVSILDNGKFGLLDIKNNLLIPAQYSTHLEKYDTALYIASKNKLLGLIDHNNTTKTPFIFEQVIYWSDTLALVQEDGEWGLFNIRTEEYTYEAIDGMEIIKNEEGQVMIKARKEEKYGILSNKKEELVPPAYHEVRNIGTTKVPVFLAEIYIKEADFYVVIYYNAKGEIIRKQAYDRAQYEMISCND